MNEKKIPCECGHQNPHGTEICEACGKPLEDVESSKLINMRYEGSARRSQTYHKTVVDKIWNFFSSVKVGVWLIVVTLIASAIGTIFPQEMYIPPTVTPAQYYQDEYGVLGKLYYELGFHNLYGSWWYILLIASIGISIVIASIDRYIPLRRALKNQRVTRHDNFMKRQRIFGTSAVNDAAGIMNTMKERLKGKKFHVREENGNLFAEKGRFSRWGPYVNHTGLVIFLLGAMLRFVPGMYVDEVLWVRDGETKVVPGTEGEYYLKNEQFIMETYESGDDERFDEALNRVGGAVAKNYQTNAVLYKRTDEIIPGAEPELEEVKDYKIRVNEPLKFEGYAVYQVDYKLNELNKMSFTLEKKETEEKVGEMITVDLNTPKDQYDLGDGYKVELLSYFPDFYFSDDGPATRSRIPNNPAFIFKMYTPEKPEGEVSFVGIRMNVEPNGENLYKMSFAGIDTKNVAGLTVRKDYTLGFIALGGLIFMIGVVQGMYWNHRRIWLKQVEGDIWIAAHTNKNWFGLKRDIETLIADTELMMPEDQADQKEKKIS